MLKEQNIYIFFVTKDSKQHIHTRWTYPALCSVSKLTNNLEFMENKSKSLTLHHKSFTLFRTADSFGNLQAALAGIATGILST